MLVESFTPDQQVTLVPNPNYWGKKATVPKVVFVPVLDSNAEVNAFRAGEVDMIYPQNQIGLRKKIEAVDGAKYTSSRAQWEHFDLLTTVKGLDEVRCAGPSPPCLRQQIVERVVKDANDDGGARQRDRMKNQGSTCRLVIYRPPATSPRPRSRCRGMGEGATGSGRRTA
jgi:peptide/nickel transport system substrate-binding protein